jgi:hypothetical protein
MQLNNRVGRLETWADENMVRWSEALTCWRIMTILFDEALCRCVNDEARGRVWGAVVRGMVQEARENGSLP